jgi:membrane associated rhomboid family serine protease
MIQDRPYMRDHAERGHSGVLPWLISLVVALFVVQNLTFRLPGLGISLERLLGLAPAGIRAGHVWTLLTYGFLHSTGNLLQIVAYLVVVYLAGREVIPLMGTRRFVGLYASSLVAGGLLWTAVHWNQSDTLLGASAAVWALIVVYACFFPNREVNLLVFFVLPVTFRPKFLALGLLAIDLCGLVFYEILRLPFPFYAAHSAHLGGMAAGWIYYRYVHESNWSLSSPGAEIDLPRWMKQRQASKTEPAAASFSVNLGDRGSLRAEVDRILDKINSLGFASLSADEKRVLDEARDLISRR